MSMGIPPVRGQSRSVPGNDCGVCDWRRTGQHLYINMEVVNHPGQRGAAVHRVSADVHPF
jgi:hypothetical protein